MDITINIEHAVIGSAPEPAQLAAAVIADQPKLAWSGTLCDGKNVDYDTAEAACKALGAGWRLPTRMELESILDLTRHNPAIDTDRFPDTKSDWYWSSTPCAWSSSAAWIVHFYYGLASDGDLRASKACVRAVRSLPAGEYQGTEAEGVSLRALHSAWKAARRGKKPSGNQLAFDVRWADGLLQLQQELAAGTWRPRPSTCFVAARPKAREIHAPDFADRIVHHWLVPTLEAIWERRFIADSYANRKGKGSHAAVRRLHAFARQVNDGQGGGYYLQLDIHNYFNSIHRATLWRIIKPVIQRHRVPVAMQLATHALLRYPPLHAGVHMRGSRQEFEQVPSHKRLVNAQRGCGLPIGNLSSQLFANIYLDQLDQFVKHRLKARRYIRYVDDFVLVHRDRAVLEAWQAQIEGFLMSELRLRLKPEIYLRLLTDGIDFLGYIIRPTHMLVRRRVVSHLREALAAWENRHVTSDGIRATPAELHHVQSLMASYAGHLRHASSFRLRRAIYQRFRWLGCALRHKRFAPAVEHRLFFFPFHKGGAT